MKRHERHGYVLHPDYYVDGAGIIRCRRCLRDHVTGHALRCPLRGVLMFPPNTPMTLTKVTFTTEEVDDETRRVVECTFALAPFTPAHAEVLNVRSLLFDAGTSLPKTAIDAAVLRISVPPQRLTFRMAPDQVGGMVVFADVKIDETLRIKAKRDREPVVVDATLKVNFVYPSPEDLFYLANGVDDTHYLTFEAEQLALGLAGDAEAQPPRLRQQAIEAGDELRPGVHAEHR